MCKGVSAAVAKGDLTQLSINLKVGGAVLRGEKGALISLWGEWGEHLTACV